MENNPDGHLLKVLVCLFLYLESNQVIILWKVFKRIKKTRNLIFCFHYWLYLNFINTYKSPLLSSPVTDLISNETNHHLWDTLCNYIKQNRQFHLLGLTLPKNGFRYWNSKNKCWNKNQHPRDTMCANFQAKGTTLIFLAQICPKTNLELEIQKANFGIRISILEVPWVPTFRQNGQIWLFSPKFAQKWILGLEIQKTNVRIRISILEIPRVTTFRQNRQL